MGRIVAIGECMGELSETGEPGLLSMGFAGDTLNTAWYLRRRLGTDWQIDYLTAVGTDTLSGRLLDFLAGEGIGTAHVQRLSDKTMGLYYISLKDGERSFTYWRNDSAARRLARDPALVDKALQGADIAYWSGITLAILPPEDRASMIEVLSQFARRGGQVMFDPNLRPRLWDSADTMRSWIHRAAAVSDLCFPSFDDEASHFGDASPAATAERYRQHGAARVVVKNGPGDITLVHAAGDLETVAVPAAASIVDTTAAGDSFNAGYLAAELSGETMRSAVQAGAALAGRVIGARGALVPQAVQVDDK
ncbi:sugar kinase [Rhizobium sp. AG855]|uniref:sugar kinase n=1 Tax=Rhizobium sp. AG855 TaxID=2183898 RepID=UPI000E72629A|nr:sugar kinase [Rhizobium sp. AG855]RKE79255.1 2-keto-3-deoxygluconate kinase [Rhizobium sp. AG855]